MNGERETPTQVVVLTPPGRSAVAVVLVDGPGSSAAVDAHFRAANGRPLTKQPIDRIVFGHWLSKAGQPGEELIVCRTSDSTTEVHCHGGAAAVNAVQSALIESGCMAVKWEQWTNRAAPTAVTAEAQITLAECVTDRTAAILLDQFHGALERDVRDIVEQLNQDSTGGSASEAATRIAELAARSPLGMHLTSPWRVVLAGPVNVGKSSLINALVGHERCVVFNEPGVTRDVVTAAAAIDGWPVELTDTAGLRAPMGEIEAAGIELAKQAVAEADLVVLVEALEPGASATRFNGDLPGLCHELGLAPTTANGALWIANKADLAGAAGDNCSASLRVSATTGQGIAQLVDAIGQRLVPAPPPAGAAIPFTHRQVECLGRALREIKRRNLEATGAALQSLLAGDR